MNAEQRVTSSGITFKELLMQSHWADIMPKILELYPDQVDTIAEFEAAYKSLRELEPVVTEQTMILTVQEIEATADTKAYFSVDGFDPQDSVEYGLDVIPWNQWLGYQCGSRALEGLGEVEFIVHCMWEMTFYGYDDVSIQQYWKATFDDLEFS